MLPGGECAMRAAWRETVGVLRAPDDCRRICALRGICACVGARSHDGRPSRRRRECGLLLRAGGRGSGAARSRAGRRCRRQGARGSRSPSRPRAAREAPCRSRRRRRLRHRPYGYAFPIAAAAARRCPTCVRTAARGSAVQEREKEAQLRHQESSHAATATRRGCRRRSRGASRLDSRHDGGAIAAVCEGTGTP